MDILILPCIFFIGNFFYYRVQLENNNKQKPNKLNMCSVFSDILDTRIASSSYRCSAGSNLDKTAPLCGVYIL
jgi:hypothetical protein